jgi:hypothetical protein
LVLSFDVALDLIDSDGAGALSFLQAALSSNSKPNMAVNVLFRRKLKFVLMVFWLVFNLVNKNVDAGLA